MENKIFIIDTGNVEAMKELARELAKYIKVSEDTREWICETDMVKMVTGNRAAKLSAPVIQKYRRQIACKKEGRSWIYHTKSILGYLNRSAGLR